MPYNEQDRNEWVQMALQEARTMAGDADLGRLERFFQEYFRRADPSDCAERGAAALAAIAVSHLRHAQRREGRRPLVRVFNPTPNDGGDSPHTVVEIVNDDMPFLVDSATMEVARQGLSLHWLIHPIYTVRRDAAGNLLDVFPQDSDKSGVRESFIRMEVDRLPDEASMQALSEGLLKVFVDVRAAVEDWPKMRERAQQVLSALEARPPQALAREEIAETRAFLAWLLDEHFTFIGYRSQDLVLHEGQDALRVTPATGLGVLRAGAAASLSTAFAALPPNVRAYARVKDLLLLTKSNTRSTVHRPGYLDYIGIKRYDEKGEVCGEHRFLGLYTHTVYAATPFEIPVVREKVRRIMREEEVREGSHVAKSLQQILDDYPRDELFQIEAEELGRFTRAILQLGERQRLRLFVRRDRFERFVSCLIYAPREHYSTELRRTWQAILLEAFNGSGTEFNVHLSESTLARVLITVRTTPGTLPAYDMRNLEQRLADAARPWDEALRYALVRAREEAEGLTLYRRFERAFPAAYREDFKARDAVPDVLLLARLSEEAPLAIRLYRVPDDPRRLRFKLIHRSAPITLSDSMPMLEHMGVKVLEERPYRVGRAARDERSAVPERTPTNVSVSGRDGAPATAAEKVENAWIHDFGLELPPGVRIEDQADFEALQWIFEGAFACVYSGETENDHFNRLVLAARLSAEQITVLRAYAKYLRQIGFPLTQSFIENTLAAHPRIARMLMELFEESFNPASEGAEEIRDKGRSSRAIEAALDDVDNLNEDRVLRQYLALIMATLRTNYWRRDAKGERRSFLSFKFDPQRVPGLPAPKPLYEIFVYSPRFEGVHLRGGKVARGGLRWSDRAEDFRTEVLGLVKAQMVKNAVIVPVGSKGGFVLKRPPSPTDREAFMQEGIACYREYLRGLLDLTDNLVEGKTVPPPSVKRQDGDDAYLVVAADKGTATFSDYANAVAQEYGFWLDDAFASGGSAGYDHKVMGITARGAWESVKRHFGALGIDTQKQDFRVVGVGDMSGDVFGNGMLLSKHIRLVAAFDHRHIFIDPQPDSASSFAERERLFRLPRSSWDDYNKMLISAGGGIYPRSAKSIELSPQACEALGIDVAGQGRSLPPNELLRAILTAPVDLLYNGGIGTYIKSSAETHAEVGDRANDGLRVDGRELRCKVLAEGGNLGCTQRGRIEYALAGGRINTDAIDNSAGVDASDHEVNIKILLGLVLAEGGLDKARRNALLAEMTDEVAQLVLRDNYFQNQILALTEHAGARRLDAQQRFLQFLEQAGRLDRALEFLPSDEEIEARRKAGGALVRPELAVLLAYSKMWLYDEMLASELPDDEWVSTALLRYFPSPLRQSYAAHMQRHPLRREIVATHVVNSMINRTGPTLVHEIAGASGAQPHEVVRAYLLSREVFGMVPLWQSVEALDHRVPASVQLDMLTELQRLIARATTWFLRSARLCAPVDATIAHFQPAVENLFADLHVLADEASLEEMRTHAGRYVDAGVPEAIARRVAAYDTVYAALDIVEVAGLSDKAVGDVAVVWFTLSRRFGLEWLRDRIGALDGSGYWPMRAKAALYEDLAALQRNLSAQVLAQTGGPEAAVEAWARANPVVAGRASKMLEELRAGPSPDHAMLAVALREWRQSA
jgi:glutamate dehydrogenase